MPSIPGRFVRFAMVGAFAGLVDMAVVEGLVGAGGGLYASRIVSYLCAATFAWWFNRRFTFAARHSPFLFQEWLRYLAANFWGGILNYAVYAVLVSSVDVFARSPFLAVAVGSAAGLALNFAMSSRFVFRPGAR